MTYHSRGRTSTEVLVAVGSVCFLVAFMAVLCVGNYYRAKRTMHKQQQRRLDRQRAATNITNASPKSILSSSSSTTGGGSMHSSHSGGGGGGGGGVGMGRQRQTLLV